MKKYIVDLDERERDQLEELTTKGESGARKIRRARILLLADEDRIDKDIASFLGAAVATVERVRRRFVEGGLEAALSERGRPGAARKLDGRQEAYLMALACSDTPEGKGRWSMGMLADRLVELDVVEEISGETVRRTLKRGISNRGWRSNGAYPNPSARSSCGAWRTYSTSTKRATTRGVRWFASTRCLARWWPRPELPYPRRPGEWRATTTNTGAGACSTSSLSSSRRRGGAVWMLPSGAQR